jgi:DNA-binding Xre family transcriptional regulator
LKYCDGVMGTRNRANQQAGMLVEKALSSGMSLAIISEKIGVGLSTIQRWRSTGKGEAVLVRKLERLVGSVEITPDELATFLAGKYVRNGKRKTFAVFNSDLYRVVGSLLDTNGYLEEVREKLKLRGYELLQTRKGGRVIYHVISFARIYKLTSGNLRDMKDRWRETIDESMPQEDEETEE